MTLMAILMDKAKRDYYLRCFRAGRTQITFLKKDGTTRVMECTLKSEFIPKHKQLGAPEVDGSKPIMDSVMEALEAKQLPTKTRKENPDVCVVFDLEKQEWRSFRWDSLVSWKLL